MDTPAPTTRSDPWQMDLIHRLIRRGFSQARDFVLAVPGDGATRRGAVAGYIRFHLDGLHAHHSTEDELIWPALHERASMSSALVDRMEAQHAAVASAIESTRRSLESWEAGGDADALVRAFDAVAERLAEHLAEEERDVVPLIAQHLTQDEWENVGKLSFSKFRPNQRFTAMGEMEATASPEESTRMSADLPAPVRLIWRVVGRRKYDKFMAALRG